MTIEEAARLYNEEWTEAEQEKFLALVDAEYFMDRTYYINSRLHPTKDPTPVVRPIQPTDPHPHVMHVDYDDNGNVLRMRHATYAEAEEAIQDQAAKCT